MHAAEVAGLKDQLSTVILMANQRIKLADDGRRALEERFLQALTELKQIRRLSGMNLEAITASAPEHWKN